MECTTILQKYIEKFNDTPPLPYGWDYDDEPILKMMEKAVLSGRKLTLDDYGEIEERVIVN